MGAIAAALNLVDHAALKAVHCRSTRVSDACSALWLPAVRDGRATLCVARAIDAATQRALAELEHLGCAVECRADGAATRITVRPDEMSEHVFARGRACVRDAPDALAAYALAVLAAVYCRAPAAPAPRDVMDAALTWLDVYGYCLELEGGAPVLRYVQDDAGRPLHVFRPRGGLA